MHTFMEHITIKQRPFNQSAFTYFLSPQTWYCKTEEHDFERTGNSPQTLQWLCKDGQTG